jgi:hypothetical protein
MIEPGAFGGAAMAYQRYCGRDGPVVCREENRPVEGEHGVYAVDLFCPTCSRRLGAVYT